VFPQFDLLPNPELKPESLTEKEVSDFSRL
jgi:hypothetical protein